MVYIIFFILILFIYRSLIFLLLYTSKLNFSNLFIYVFPYWTGARGCYHIDEAKQITKFLMKSSQANNNDY